MNRDDFIKYFPGRRITFTFPLDCLGKRSLCNENETDENTRTVHVTVLDCVKNVSLKLSCAAIIVPLGQELDWIFQTEEGQWQLSVRSKAKRLIVFSREQISQSQLNKWPPAKQLEILLDPMTMALSPNESFLDSNIPCKVPFLEYQDEVLSRKVLEITSSEINGDILVEDVEMRQKEGNCNQRNFRRWLRFQKTPNHVQSEMLLLVSQKNSNPCKVSIDQTNNFELNWPTLPHGYLSYMVSGICLFEQKFWKETGQKVLVLGGGAFSLPSYLSAKFGFLVQAVEIDPNVVFLARKYFNLGKETPKVDVVIQDAAEFVENLARKAVVLPVFGNINNKKRRKDFPEVQRKKRTKFYRKITPKSYSFIALDLDSSSPCGEFGCPPPQFSTYEFFTNLKTLMVQSGILALNVLPNIKEDLNKIIEELGKAFQKVFQLDVDGYSFVLFGTDLEISESVEFVPSTVKGYSLDLNSSKEDIFNLFKKAERVK